MPEELKNIIDSSELQLLMDDFYALTGILIAILDLKGDSLAVTGWQDICAKFHRIHPETLLNCLESDAHLTQHPKPGEYVLYKCKNNMWDVATPIFIGDRHMGNLFIGQFFYEDETPDIDLFEKQADRYGFDKKEYLDALGRVPRFSRDKIDAVMKFSARLALIISRLSDSNLRLGKLLLDQKHDEKLLEESEKKYKDIFENATEGIYRITPDGRYIDINPASAKMFGYASSEEMMRSITDIGKQLYVNPEDREMSKRLLADQGIVRGFEVQMYRKDGSKLWISINAHVIRDKGGTILCYEGTNTDITERKEAEEKIRQHAKTLEKLHDLIVDITSTHDLDEILQKVTQSATDLIGADGGGISLYGESKEVMVYTYFYNMPEELQKVTVEKGNGAAEYVMRANTSIIIDNYPEHPKALKEFIDAGVKTVIGVPLAVKEKCFGTIALFGMNPEKRFTKEQLDLLESIGRQAAIAIEDVKLLEEIKRFSATLEQKVAERTSELHHTQAALLNVVDDLNQKQQEIETVNAKLLSEIAEHQRAEELLRSRNDELKAFTYTVSHDLKAPLRGIAGYAQELGSRHRAGLSERAQFCINQILTATSNLDNLIEDLLHYSRLDVATPALADVNLLQLLQTIMKNRDRIIAEQGALISVDIPSASLRCWEQGLMQALANVIDNALKYSRNAQPPRIDIRGEESADAFRIIVSDNGIGFDMKYHDRIFGLFNRLVRQEEYEGTGAGLAIAKKALDKQGGSIRAESQPGVGTTFFIELPKGKAVNSE